MKKKQTVALDKIWSEAVKKLAGYKCEVCGKSGKVTRLNSCHIVGRRHRATRWGSEIDGKYDLCGFSGCYYCHSQYDQHGPLETHIRKKVIGEKRYEKIVTKAKGLGKTLDYEKVKSSITQITT